MTPIRYAIAPLQPEAHMFAVTVTVDAPDSAGQVFTLPAWIPGSYMIRDFARNIVRIRADAGGEPVSLTKLDKQTWQAEPLAANAGPLTLSYEVYAWDLSVRAAHLDTTHGFFNGSSVFLRVVGQDERPCTVDIHAPAGDAYADWRVATSLPEAKGAGGARRYGFGRYLAADYDELIDHPVEMGTFALASFRACGVQHDVVFTGRVPQLDIQRVCRDLKQICEAQIKLFEPRTARAPMLDSNRRYVFMTMVTTDGYGGLEHRASTALMCARNDLPVRGNSEQSEGYRTFLGLCSHEYFHTWNVKRIKPAAYVPYQLAQETYSPLLWLFEGFTSYYDDLILARTGLVTEKQYVDILAKTWNGVLRGSGRTKQSVAESAFDAWTKYYRQDENAPNAIVSYYTKGSLVALALDLTIREKTKGRKSLDDVMRALWQRYGRDFYAPGARQRGVTEAEVYALFDEISGLKLGNLLRALTEGTGEIGLVPLFRAFGIRAETQKPSATAVLGIKSRTDEGWVRVTQVLDGGAGQQGGLSAGDLLAAVDGLRVAPGQLDKMLARYRPGDEVALHVFRRDELHVLPVTLAREPATQYKVSVEADKHAGRARWLGQ
ncbi:M61 family metallopeptidase [Cupriavidus sp. 2SB]|uniref:M61 family metallopeptidase n=1 Tax=Cupriavidus sp. 2SB TaxID=2502199 RepID=UPI0010FA00FD|nr:M61 family metallopeptidase [Cupriavidus sp. 2SB]